MSYADGRIYFDFTANSAASQQVDDVIKLLRDWSSESKDMPPMTIIDKYVTMYIGLIKEIGYGGLNTTRQYILDLVKNIIADVVKNNIISNHTINNFFVNKMKINSYDSIDELNKDLIEMNNVANTVIDTKRMIRNHDIIKKRYNLNKLCGVFFTNYCSEIGFTIPLIFNICRKLDTYNLELPDKINLMCEELAYLLDTEFDYKENSSGRSIDRESMLYTIIPGVFTYILGTYSSDGIPTKVTRQVIDAAIRKLEKSSFFTQRGIIVFSNKDYLDTLKGAAVDVQASFFNVLAGYQIDGSINTKEGMLKFMGRLERMSYIYLKDYLWYVLYYYAIATNKMNNELNISISKSLNTIVSAQYKNTEDKIFAEHIKAFQLRTLIEFVNCLKINLFAYSEVDVEEKERTKNAISEINKVIDILMAEIDYSKIEKDQPVKIRDRKDDSGFPNQISTYECKALAASDYIADKLIKCVDEDTKKHFIDIACEKSIISNEAVGKFLNKALDTNPEFYDLDYMKSKLNETYNELSEDIHSTPTAEAYNTIGIITGLTNKIDSILSVPEIVREDAELVDYNTDDIDTTIEEVLNTNIDNYIIAETTSLVAGVPLQEMKLSSYANMVMDKFRQGYDYLNDKQKLVFDEIDRMADSFDRMDDKESRAEARMQIVKGKMLPPLSRCLKTLLLAGALSFINPWFGLLVIIIKYVTSRNATKEERQAVCDELEVEIQMIDRKINDAVEDKDYKLERKLRLLKKKMLVQYSKISFDNMVKWDRSLYMKSDTDETGSKITLKDEQ